MKCPFLESEDCETCGYYDYVPEKKCYNCLHPFLNADDEKQQDWKKIVSYMRECGYEWSYEHMKHDYQRDHSFFRTTSSSHGLGRGKDHVLFKILQKILFYCSDSIGHTCRVYLMDLPAST